MSKKLVMQGRMTYFITKYKAAKRIAPQIMPGRVVITG
jgi:hypothetical protein